MRTVPIAELTESVKTWSPSREPGSKFDYIDLSAVERSSKVITAATPTVGSEAPSRARWLVARGDVLVSTVRPNRNAVAVVPPELDGATASTGFAVLRPTAELDGRFLFHWVRTPEFIGDMVRKATGASYPAVSDRIVKHSAMPAPILPEQRRIAAILDHADALRAKRYEVLAHLAALTQSIFRDVFGDPSSPENAYRRGYLSDLITAALDGPHVSPTYATTGIPFLSTRHIRPGEILWSDLKFLTLEDALVQWKKVRPEYGDVLYTKGGTTGVAAAVTTRDEFAVWVHVAVLKTDKAVVDPIWLEAMLNSPYCYVQSQRLTHGIANRDLGLKRMVNIELLVPTLDDQRRFASTVGRIRDGLSTSRKALAATNDLFASLQARAFRGEL